MGGAESIAPTQKNNYGNAIHFGPHCPKSNMSQFIKRLVVGTVAVVVWAMVWVELQERQGGACNSSAVGYKAPLVMSGGDPYIRALMRTISASESNVRCPYSVLYGGQHISNLSHHPDRCLPIVAGPNIGNCTTAAGRYQFITTTWQEVSHLYHPHPEGFPWHRQYSFAPQYQDAVVHAWLSDPAAWGADIPQMLRDDRIEDVLGLLSGTWTSLGYGIETNSMSSSLPDIYWRILQEEKLASAW